MQPIYFVTKMGVSSSKTQSKPLTQCHKSKTMSENDRKYDKKKRKPKFEEHWVIDFAWLRKADDGTVYGNMYREYPLIADNTSGLFIGKVVEQRDTLTAHEKSCKHVSC